MKGEESIGSSQQGEARSEGAEKSKVSKHSHSASSGGGLGDAAVPQREFEGRCPQGSDLPNLNRGKNPKPPSLQRKTSSAKSPTHKPKSSPLPKPTNGPMILANFHAAICYG